MSIDQMEHKGLKELAPSSAGGKRARRWLSIGLIVVGILLLGFAGLRIYLDTVVVPEPPPPVGLVEPTRPPSLEDNPLLVLSEDNSAAPVPAENFAGPASEETSPSAASSGGEPGTTMSGGEPPPGGGARDPSGVLEGDTTSARASSAASAVAAMPGAGRGMQPGGSLVPAPPPISPATSPPTRIVAPSIKLDGEVVEVGWKQVAKGSKIVSVWEVAKYAAGWHKNSGLPGGGGNIVLSGHHNVRGEIFRYIVDLNPGDTITLYADDRPYTYTVESRFAVRDKGVSEKQRQENARWIGAFPDERLTLVTCWPYTGNTHRVIVIAKPER